MTVARMEKPGPSPQRCAWRQNRPRFEFKTEGIELNKTFFITPILSAMIFMSHPGYAADTGLFLQELSHSGLPHFAKWADQYYAERRAGKSGFDQAGAQTGKVLGGLLGGSLGLLGDDPMKDVKAGAKAGIGYGEVVGRSMGKTIGTDELEELITDYMNDRSAYLEKANAVIRSCVSGGTPFSTCRRSRDISEISSSISELNHNYCRRALELREPGDPSKPIFTPALCQGG